MNIFDFDRKNEHVCFSSLDEKSQNQVENIFRLHL